jgi:CubicO group peptidase (beta-lactamase class C family)
MPAEDLARWDIGMIERRLLKPASYAAMQTEVLLSNGQGTRYGLGLSIRNEANHHALVHGGAVSGFSSHNIVFPEDRAAVVVLTNLDASPAPQQIATRIAPLLFETQDAHSAQVLVRARQVLEELQQGRIDRSLLTGNAVSYFTSTALNDFAAALTPLGAITDLKETYRQERGGMTFRELIATFSQRKVDIWYREMPDGLIEQFQVAGIE